jgi:3-phosphoshikimate 1-carboxyvinyltransferase
MRERPMATLIDALRRQGAAIACLEREGHLPLKLGPHAAALRGGDLRLERPASSQFVSALVFAGCLAAAPLTIVLEQGSPARPYIDMTLATVRAFGGDARWLDDASIRVTPSTLTGRRFAIEPDASAATYPLALAAIYGGTTTIEGLGTDSLQGDAHFAGILERFGARVEQTSTRTTVHGTGFLTSQSVDLGEMPDTALTVAVLALFARGPTRITGVEVLRHHESDRIAAAATELRKLGATVVEHHDGLTIEPPSVLPTEPVAIDTYDDHRMAMAFSLAGHVTIMDPMCVRKTFPTYFEELTKHGMVHGWT